MNFLHHPYEPTIITHESTMNQPRVNPTSSFSQLLIINTPSGQASISQYARAHVSVQIQKFLLAAVDHRTDLHPTFSIHEALRDALGADNGWFL